MPGLLTSPEVSVLLYSIIVAEKASLVIALPEDIGIGLGYNGGGPFSHGRLGGFDFSSPSG
jgi:hypothetical protein